MRVVPEGQPGLHLGNGLPVQLGLPRIDHVSSRLDICHEMQYEPQPHRTIIRCVSRETRREFYQVQGTAKERYCCIPGWCSCPNFAIDVVGKRSKVVCKHELAVMIAAALNHSPPCCSTNEVDEERWATELDLATLRASLGA